MTKPYLDDLLRSGEWTGAEFKASKSALPKSVFETVSAFANTRGGWIVLGVTQVGERFEVSGVDEPDKVQNDFLSVLHAGQKISHDVDVSEHRYEHDGKVVLAFSRKKGFSKGTLAQGCAAVGIRYEHLPEFGIASEKRKNLATRSAVDALFAEYERDLLPTQGAALAKLRAWLDAGERVALTCFECARGGCHRHCVAEALGAGAKHLWSTIRVPRCGRPGPGPTPESS